MVLAFEGCLDIATAPYAQRALTEYLGAHGPVGILDTSRMHFIDSKGIGVLLGAAKAAKDAGGCLYLVDPAVPGEAAAGDLRPDVALPGGEPPATGYQRRASAGDHAGEAAPGGAPAHHLGVAAGAEGGLGRCRFDDIPRPYCVEQG
jgi:hypothetical protein